MSGPPQVSVIGGGLAGLTAAIACADAGAAVTLFEARPRFGGATWSFERNGLAFDNGQHVYLRCCTAYRRLLERLDTVELAPINGPLSIPVYAPGAHGGAPRRAVIGRSSLPVPLHLAKALLSYSHLGVLDRLRLGRVLGALGKLSLADPALDRETFGSFLRRHGQSDAAITRLFDLIVLPTTNLRSDEVSLALAAKVFKTGLLEETDAADIGWAAAPLAAVHVEPSLALIERLGGRVERRAKVHSIARVESGRLELSLEGSRVESDAVIVATPPDAASELLEPLGVPFAPALREFASEPILDVHLVFDRKVMDEPLAAGVASPVQYVFDRTKASGLGGSGQCLALSISGAAAEIGERPEVLRERYVTALGELFPRVREATLVDFVVSREHAATFRGVPGTGLLRAGASSGVEHVALAGAWTATGWPATMEGAVRSGNRAAWHALQGLGATRQLPELEEVVA
jgi:squalene-associated FAD-dependent desaturase